MFQNPEHILTRGQAAFNENRFIDAARAFDELRTLLPGETAIAQMAARAWQLAGDMVRERTAWLAAYASAGDIDTPTLYEIGAGLLGAGAPFEAKRCFGLVAQERTHDPAALGALAAACRSTGDLAEGQAVIARALALDPKAPALCLTAAQIHHAMGNLPEAHRWLDRADTLRPHHGPTQLQRGMTSLLGGPCAAGWAGFEHRGVPASTIGASPWMGDALEGEVIAVLAEQGLGDLFHFLRFVPRLFDRGASQVLIEAPPSTHRLLASNGFTVVAPGQLPATPWAVPLLSLPHRLGIDTDYAAEPSPYLHAGAPRDGERWRPGARPRIGVAWKGNPAFLATALRDFDPTLLPLLAASHDAEWVSLQVGAPVPPGFTSDLGEAPDWLDTARHLASLDAIVSVDTSIAHLAGALGLPTVVLLPYSPDWRWGLHGDRTPWYPSARLVRQRAPRDWASVIPAVQAVLTDLLRQLPTNET